MVTRPIRLRVPLGCLFQSVLREQFVRNEPSVLYHVNLSAQLCFNDDSRKSSPTSMHHPSAPSWRVERSLPIRLPWAIPLHWTPSLLTTPRQSGWSHCGWLRHVSRDALTHTQGTTYFQPCRWDVYSDNPNPIRWWRLRPRSVVWQNGQRRTGCSGATCNQRHWQCVEMPLNDEIKDADSLPDAAGTVCCYNALCAPIRHTITRLSCTLIVHLMLKVPIQYSHYAFQR